jgi:hypothetical protein
MAAFYFVSEPEPELLSFSDMVYEDEPEEEPGLIVPGYQWKKLRRCGSQDV